jgi:hypothetical protein
MKFDIAKTLKSSFVFKALMSNPSLMFLTGAWLLQ